MDYLTKHFDDVLQVTGQHLQIVLYSVVFAFLIAFPLALIAARNEKASVVINAICNAIYSVPSLALLVLLISITGLGMTTAVVALTLYNLYLLVKNIEEGFKEVSPSIKEIGKGMGMDALQRFFSIELPLAAPLIVSGLKFAVVTTTAGAVLASLVGAGGLGNLVFTGLVTRNWNKVIIGTVASVLVASVMMIILQLLENHFLRVATGRRKA